MNAEATDDDALMRAFARGDARAFDRLYKRHQGALYRFVRRLLGSVCASQTDEVFQDTWMRVIQARERWQPQGATFRTWLFTLAHHRAIDCLRKSGRELQFDVAEGDDESAAADALAAGGAAAAWASWPAAPAAADEASDRAFWRAAGERLLLCLDALPVAQRAVFLLHHEDGLTLDELAASLEVGFETAKSRLRYAMTKLRGCMGAYLPAGVPA